MILQTMSPQNRNALLLKYAEGNSEYQAVVDDALKKIGIVHI
jgi:hypothetical protein